MNHIKKDGIEQPQNAQPGAMLASYIGHELAQLDSQQQSQLALVESCIFDMNKIPKVSFLLNVGKTDCVPENNLIVFTGKPGKGKSSAMAIVAGVLMGYREFGGIRAVRKVKRVLWVDTEQNAPSYAKRLQTLCDIAGFAPTRPLPEFGLLAIHLKKVPPLEGMTEAAARRVIIELAVSIWHPDLVVIDGIFDCVDDSERDTPGEVQAFWERLLTEHNCTIMTAIHTNKQDDNLPYAIGTQLMKKASDIFTCYRGENSPIIEVKHTRARESDFAPTWEFRFASDAAGNSIIKGSTEWGRALEAVRELYEQAECYSFPELKKRLCERIGCKSDAHNIVNRMCDNNYLKRENNNIYRYLL